MKRRTIILLLTLWLFSSIAMAQQSESQLAFKYYRDKEYQKASSLFMSLYQRTNSKNYLNYYIYCLISLEEHQKAEKTIRKEVRKHPHDNTLLVELGYLYKLENREDKMTETYQKALDKLQPNNPNVRDLANAFIGKREYQLALKTYQKGRVLLANPQLYNFETANIYLYQRDYPKMIEQYLDALEVKPSSLNQIQSRLQSAIFQDINSSLDDILKNKLLTRIQKNPQTDVYNQLLLWFYIQKKEFAPALRQARALDLRQEEKGKRLLTLAQLASKNRAYQTAIQAFKYVIEKGDKYPYYITARRELLELKLIMIQEQWPNNIGKFKQLEGEYLQMLEETKFDVNVMSSIMSLARIQAFHLGETGKAITNLNRALQFRNLHITNKNKVKLLLADIKLLAGNSWEAILLYAQVEKTTKNNPIGYQAKLKKAKTAYYTGDLEWARAQLDILKGSTSKLIANDALALSELISQNTGLDSTDNAMKLYARADYLSYRQLDTLALETLDSLLFKYPSHTLVSQTHWKKYTLYYSRNNYPMAIKALNIIIDDHPQELLADKALFHRAQLYEHLKEKQKALDSYKMLLKNYPESIFTIESRNRYRKLANN